jgi:hypothetical protein
MFKKAPNINTNPLPDHTLGSGFVNALEMENPNSLKGFSR